MVKNILNKKISFTGWKIKILQTRLKNSRKEIFVLENNNIMALEITNMVNEAKNNLAKEINKLI